MKDMTKKITLLCPVCGNDQFEFPEGFNEDTVQEDAVLKCSYCGREYTKAELIELNGEIIDNGVEEFKNEIGKEVEMELKKIFRR